MYVRTKFSCVRSSHNLCAHAHAHSLEGTLRPTLCIRGNCLNAETCKPSNNILCLFWDLAREGRTLRFRLVTHCEVSLEFWCSLVQPTESGQTDVITAQRLLLLTTLRSSFNYSPNVPLDSALSCR